MIYTAIDTFYLTDDQLRDSPSRKDGIDEAAETTLRIYGCDLIQESGILLRLPQAVMATAQVLFHRFYCKKSFARFSAKRVAASCVWLAGKLEESPRRSRHIIFVFHRMECRRENLPMEYLDPFSTELLKEWGIHRKLDEGVCEGKSDKYSELRHDLIRTERHLLKEMGFICHVEHPHKFISNYLATLEAPELTQEAWNLANDSLRTTICVRFKSEVVACGVVYAAARRHRVPLPEEPPWWSVFDADEAGIQEVYRVLAHLYSLPKAQYIPVYKDNDSFSVRRALDTHASKDSPASAVASDKGTPIPSSQEKNSLTRAGREKVKENSDNKDKPLPVELNGKGDQAVNSKSEKSESNVDRAEERERSRSRGRDRDIRSRDSDHERERDREDRDRAKRQRSRDKSSGYSDKEKSRHRSSRDRAGYYSSGDKDRHRRH